MCYATLHSALSVRRTVGLFVHPLVRPSVRLSARPSHSTFFFCGFWPHCSCPDDQVTSNTTPAHPHATGVSGLDCNGDRWFIYIQKNVHVLSWYLHRKLRLLGVRLHPAILAMTKINVSRIEYVSSLTAIIVGFICKCLQSFFFLQIKKCAYRSGSTRIMRLWKTTQRVEW